MTNSIKVLPYDHHWPKQFENEALKIREVLGDNCIEIHHIGSTSVPHLAAKPIIDMMPVVASLKETEETVGKMVALGYEAKGESGIAFRRFYTKDGFNVHIFEKGSHEVLRHLVFRDYLRNDPKTSSAYAKLKLELAELHPNDINAYCEGKIGFIKDVNEATGYIGLRLIKALVEREWEAVREFRQEYFEELKSEDPLKDTLNDEEHIHLLLIKGSLLKGYAHIQILPDMRAALRIFGMERIERNQNDAGKFLGLIEKWLKDQGIKTLHAKSAKHTANFYSKANYVRMPFNDPHSGGLLNIGIGKIL